MPQFNSKSDVLRAIHEAVQETLETMVFAEAIPTEIQGDTPNDEGYVSRVVVKRPFEGRMTLILSRQLAQHITQAALGQTEVQAEDLVLDAVAEIANTVGGRIMAQLVKAHESFDLGIPDTQSGSISTGNAPHGIHEAFLVDGEFLSVELDLEQAA